MVSKYRMLDAESLRADLVANAFGEDSPGLERLGLTVELLPVRATVGANEDAPARVPLFGSRELPGTLDLLALWALENGIEVLPPGERSPGDEARADRGRFHFGAGGQLGFSTALYASPRLAFEECARTLDKLRDFLRGSGIELVGVGADPWHAADSVPSQDTSAVGLGLDRAFAGSALGRRALRSGCALRVRLGFGGPVKAGLRWRAAQLLAPVATAAFAASPLEDGRHPGMKSTRARDWRVGEPSRTGFPYAFGEDPDGDPVEQYLDFALAARVVETGGPEGVGRLLHPLTFGHWLEHGIDGDYPDLDDWHRHLSLLYPEVRPAGGLQLGSAEALGRAFWSVPLTFWSALLSDSEALLAIDDRLRSTAADLPDRWALAARVGPADPGLREDVRWAFATAARTLLRLPPGWVSNEMLAAFVAFGERFAQRGYAPADELLDAFLQRGGFGLDVWRALERRWCRLAGTPEPEPGPIAIVR